MKRRHFWSGIWLLTILSTLVAACSAPVQPPAPAQKSEAPAKAEPAAAANPAGTSADWDKVVTAGKQEKTIVLSTHAGSGYEKFVEAARKGVPDLDVQASTIKASDFVPRVIAEQQNGQYLWDVHVGPLSNIFTVLTPAGGLEPIMPFLSALPAEVKDDSKWYGKFGMYTDPKNPVSLVTSVTENGGAYINREVVGASELATIDELLDPKWKGKVVIYDPTVSNGGGMSMAGILGTKGPDFLKKLLIEQDATYVETSRQATEWIAQGRYSIGFGMDDTYLKELQSKGVGTKVERNRSYGAYTLTNGVSVLKNAPHPNASKVFLSWLLSKDGQDAWAQLSSVDANTRRNDVEEYHKDSLPDYKNIEKYTVIQGTSSGDVVLKQALDITGSKR